MRIVNEIQALGVAPAIAELPAGRVMPDLAALSARQSEIVARLLRGERVPSIARSMFLSQSTVRNHLSVVYGKLGVHSQQELIERLRRPSHDDPLDAAQAGGSQPTGGPSRGNGPFDARQLSAILGTSTDAVYTTNLDGIVTSWNEGARQLYGWTADEIVGAPLTLLIPPGRTVEPQRFLAQIARDESVAGYETVQVTKDRREVHVAVSLSPVHDANGRITGAAIVARDITDRRRLEQARDLDVLTDALTGLPNRTLLVDRLETAIGRLARGHGTVAVLFIDIDDFKIVNDSLGHPAGDELLVTIAQRLRNVLRPTDTLARFGGDEFVVVCDELNEEEEVTAVAERFLEAVSPKVALELHDLYPSVTIGIAITSDPNDKPEHLLRDGDAAMHRAKSNGRGQYARSDETLRSRALARLEMEEALRHALTNDELSVQYQPVVELDSDRIIAVEALVRWMHPHRGLLPPAAFLGLAEETGLIAPIGEQVLHASCRQLAEWHAAGATRLRVSLNLSARQLGDAGLVDDIAAVLAEHGVAPEFVCFEITEHALTANGLRDLKILSALRDLGVRLSVDDFGTGYSSLLSLRHFPVQELKIDRTFVAGVGRDEQDTAIVEGVIGLAGAFGLDAVAEGVERPEQRDLLLRLGCDMGQGYLWGPPVPPPKMKDLLFG